MIPTNLKPGYDPRGKFDCIRVTGVVSIVVDTRTL